MTNEIFLIDFFFFRAFVNGLLFIFGEQSINKMLMGNWVSKGEVKDKAERRRRHYKRDFWNSRENVLDSYRLLFE